MNQSENITDLIVALVAAQKEFSAAVKAKTNGAFDTKYVDLAGAIEAAQPALLAHGIAVIQSPQSDPANGTISVTTRIMHTSGQWIDSTLTLPGLGRGGFNAQSAGSSITYARRYSYMGMLGFAPEDDDGNAASSSPAPLPQAIAKSEARVEKANQVAGTFNWEEPHLDCYPVEIKQGQAKNGATFLAIKLNGLINGKALAFCWHSSLFDALEKSKDRDCRFVINPKATGPEIEDVLKIGNQSWPSGLRKSIPAKVNLDAD